tara:strand:+ start:28 stop:1014 length:987 start_codon:yes stop_codon:yes gene_type:complete
MVLRRSVAFCILVMLEVVSGDFAIAHEIRPAYLQITEVGRGEANYHILWKQPVVQNRRLPIDPVFSDECELSDLSPPEVTSVAILYNWQTECDLSETSIHVTGLMVNHTDVLVRVETLDDEVENYVLRPSNPTLDLKEGGAPALDYFIIGVDHLVFGIDHVLFVIGLFLFIQAPIALIKTITAFTVSHSITLALSVLGLVKLDQGPIELVIALSILFLARELVQEESKRSRLTLGRPWVMAFFFGLLHGLGFAGALADIGLPKDDLWLSLLLFNLGIEAGQIAVILVLAIVAWALSQINWKQYFNTLAAWGMGSVAAFWTIDRALLLF